MKRRHLSGSRIMTNGTISPRLSASPQPPHHHSPASSTSGSSSGYLMGIAAAASHSPRLTPTLPAIRETISPSGNGGKMPLNGKVPGYRQPAGEIWIDGELAVDRPTRRISPLGHNSPSSPLAANNIGVYPMVAASSNGAGLTNSSLTNHLNNNSSNNVQQMATPSAKPEIRRYGFMDDFKASMITHWVENQKDRHTTEGCSTSSTSTMFLTQFKQADSSDSGSEKLAVDALNNSIKADVHQPPQNNNAAQVKDRQKPPPAPPRRSSSKEKDISCITSAAPNMDFMKKSANNDNQLIQDAVTSHKQSRLFSPDSDGLEIAMPADGDGGEGGAKLSPRGETEGSEASSVAPLPEPNFEQLFPSSLSGKI